MTDYQKDIENDNSDWRTWSKYVLLELRRLANEIDKIKDKQNDIENKLLVLNIKSGAWGAVGAALTIIGYLVLEFLKKRIAS